MRQDGPTGRQRTEPPIVPLARAAVKNGLAALAGNDAALAMRWLERAHRLVPLDPNAALSLASTCLADDPARAAELFADIASRHDIRQAWLGLVASRLRLAGPQEAAVPLATLLSRHALSADAAGLAASIGNRPGSPGWCALRSDGTLEVHASGTPKIRLDRKRIRGTVLPAHWQTARTIDVRLGDVPLLGSPIDVSAIRRIAGCVEASDGGIIGWAWHPGDPDQPPTLTVTATGWQKTFTASDESVSVPDTGALARPRSFRLSRTELPDRPGLVHITGPDGNDLPGSPLDPLGDQAALIGAAQRLARLYPAGPAPKYDFEPPGLLRADAPAPPHPVGADTINRGVTVVIPVHNGGPVVESCLASVLATVQAGTRILVIDDGSTDAALVANLKRLAAAGDLIVLRHARAQGFAAAANAGFRSASNRDIILLNSDTLVPPGWLERLRAAAYAEPDIGTVTPLSNEASILSYPGPAGSNPKPDQAETNRLDRIAERANGPKVVDIPVGVGFCLYIRRDCLNAVGAFRADLFAQGYGEENDFCLRARRLGWRNVALTGSFVGHLGGSSFGDTAVHLRARNSRILEQHHPGYEALIDQFIARDPLAASRRQIDLLQWRERGRRSRGSVVLIAHNHGGGTEQRLIRAIEAHDDAGLRPIVLRPAETPAGGPAIAVRDGRSDDLPNLVFAVPTELPALLRLLRASRPETIEVHHCADFPACIYELVTRLGVDYDVHVHDYAWFCPRVSLVGAHGRYCGEPDLPDCEACVADNGHFLLEDIPVKQLRDRSAAFLADARQVIVPSDDAGRRMRRHFDGLATTTVPHEDDSAIPPAKSEPRHTAPRARPSVCVVGGIGVHKGYDVLLACARDAARRDLDLEFVIVGHTIDDSRMLATGRVFVTGRFDPQEATGLIAAQNAKLGFVASICPETWCLSLGDIWRAGLPAAAFDIGAPAERIRRTGRGFLLPLGLSASAINNTLVAAMWTADH